MKLEVDENLPVEIALSLREAGQVCKRERRALVTLDTDFANVQAFPPAEYSGLLVLRLQRQDKPHVLATFQRVMPCSKLRLSNGSSASSMNIE